MSKTEASKYSQLSKLSFNIKKKLIFCPILRYCAPINILAQILYIRVKTFTLKTYKNLKQFK